MGIGKFHNEKPFPESESQWRDSWLSWDGRRKGRSNGANGYVCFCQQRAPRTKQVLCDTPGLLCSPIGTRQHPVESPHVCLLYLVQINCSVTCWDCSAPQQALGSMQWSQPMPVSCIWFYPWPHSQTFCPMLKSDSLNAVLITVT